MHGQTSSGITSKDKKWKSSKDTSNTPEVRKDRKGIHPLQQSTSLPFPDGFISQIQCSALNKK